MASYTEHNQLLGSCVPHFELPLVASELWSHRNKKWSFKMLKTLRSFEQSRGVDQQHEYVCLSAMTALANPG